MAQLSGPDYGKDPTPLYFRLETILRSAIEQREYKPGEALPSERELGQLYGVSRITVRRALDTLERDRLVRRGRGRGGGTFVLERPRRPEQYSIGSLDRVASDQQITSIKVLKFEIRSCDPETAAILRLRPDAPIQYVERLMFTAEGPAAHVRNILPLRIGERLRRSELRTSFLRDVLTKRLSIALAAVQDEVEPYLAESHIATLLKLRPGSPLLRVTRIFIAGSGDPVNLTTLLIGNKYRVSATLRGEMFG